MSYKQHFPLAILLFGTLLVASSLPAGAQETVPLPAEDARMDAPTTSPIPWSSALPQLTPEQKAQLESALEGTHLSGPRRPDAGLTASLTEPTADTATMLRNSVPAPLATPGDAVKFRNVSFKSIIPSGYTSNVMESSTAEGGKYAFFTGNWFAARSINGGTTWTYVNPYADMADFCCDQVTLYDEARNMFIWYRMGVPNAYGVNRIRVGVSTDGGATFCNYDVQPTNVNSGWTNQWFDYPHLQKGADYLYIATNMFNSATPPSWTRTVMLRWPLDSLRACAGFSYNYYADSSWFTFVPVQGAEHIMYFASNWPSTSPYNRINVWKWPEDSTSLTTVTTTIPTWSFNVPVCGSTTGNWGGRSDDRVLTGARYMIHGTNLKIPGREILGWWWNSAAIGSLTQPYIEGVAFYEDTLTQVAGLQGRPYIWNTSTCFLYPSAAANKRGDLGIVMNYSTGTNKNPSVAFAIADDFVTAPPGFTIYNVRTSNARPSDNKWGDYNTARPFYPTQDTWIGAAHFIAGTTNCSNCSSPVFFAFGRERDRYSWSYWQSK